MILNIILLIIGFVLLIKGSDIFVDGASSTAQNFKISKVLIGLTIIAFGTSAPELAISINSIRSGSTDMAIGNVIGSCILNIFLIIGISSVIRPIKINESTIKKELPLCLLISTLLAVVLLDKNLNSDMINQITRSEAIVMLLFFLIFVYYLITLARQKKKDNSKPKFKLFKSIIFVILGLAGIIIGSDLVVDNAKDIALSIGISERLISLTIVAIGTSLPELVTAIVASKKNEQDLVIGNIVGSNIFNICIVLGFPIAILGSVITDNFLSIDLIMLLLSSLILFIFSITKHTISRVEGILMLCLYVIYYVIVFV